MSRVQRTNPRRAHSGPRSPRASWTLRGRSGGTWGACDSAPRPVSSPNPNLLEATPLPRALTTTASRKTSAAHSPRPDLGPAASGHAAQDGTGRPGAPCPLPSQAQPSTAVPLRPPVGPCPDAGAHLLAWLRPDRKLPTPAGYLALSKSAKTKPKPASCKLPTPQGSKGVTGAPSEFWFSGFHSMRAPSLRNPETVSCSRGSLDG